MIYCCLYFTNEILAPDNMDNKTKIFVLFPLEDKICTIEVFFSNGGGCHGNLYFCKCTNVRVFDPNIKLAGIRFGHSP